MYKIVEIKHSQKFIATGVEPMYLTETGDNVNEVKIRNYSKKNFDSYLEAILALDKIKRKGIYMIVKEN